MYLAVIFHLFFISGGTWRKSAVICFLCLRWGSKQCLVTFKSLNLSDIIIWKYIETVKHLYCNFFPLFYLARNVLSMCSTTQKKAGTWLTESADIGKQTKNEIVDILWPIMNQDLNCIFLSVLLFKLFIKINFEHLNLNISQIFSQCLQQDPKQFSVLEDVCCQVRNYIGCILLLFFYMSIYFKRAFMS